MNDELIRLRTVLPADAEIWESGDGFSFRLDFNTPEEVDARDLAWDLHCEISQDLATAGFAADIQEDHDTVWGTIRQAPPSRLAP